jgi:hypothetical protein
LSASPVGIEFAGEHAEHEAVVGLAEDVSAGLRAAAGTRRPSTIMVPTRNRVR